MLEATKNFAIEESLASLNDAYEMIAEGEVKSRLDLGSAEMLLVETADQKSNLIILTSSGHAAIMPADFFSLVR